MNQRTLWAFWWFIIAFVYHLDTKPPLLSQFTFFKIGPTGQLLITIEIGPVRSHVIDSGEGESSGLLPAHKPWKSVRLFNYIEGYYNILRVRSSLGYLSPINVEKQYYQANFIPNAQSQVPGETDPLHKSTTGIRKYPAQKR